MVLLGGIDIGWLLIISGALFLLVEVYSPGFCYGTGHSDDLLRYIISAGGRCLQFWPGSHFGRGSFLSILFFISRIKIGAG
jgi:hypothetical protein